MDEIEKVARAMSAGLGFNPDDLAPETGYPGARVIPRWRKEIEYAKRHLAAANLSVAERGKVCARLECQLRGACAYACPNAP